MTPHSRLNQNSQGLKFILFVLVMLSASLAQKTVYIPQFITRTGMDLNDPASQWSHSRKAETENIVIFWEPGFGSDPSTASGNYRVNMDNLKEVAEKSFATYLDSLRFVIKGSSVTDRYKLMIFLLYTTDWGAYGSGQDDLVGTLHVNPAAANIGNVVAHEIGHTFQYLAGCDVPAGGFRYGFGANASGGNGYWEQMANYLAFQVFPGMQFTAGDFTEYIRSNHLNILHETPRYANYFIGEYWAFKQGPYFQGRLWRESRRPEDPVEAYKRLTSISQEEFNDEMFEHAARLTTWDLPNIRSSGTNYITRRAQVNMTRTSDDYWIVAPAVTIENYGYNSIKLNAPATATTISVQFKGKAGQSGYRSLNIDKGGWRYGFVALLRDGTRVYSNMATARYANGSNPEGSLIFSVPGNCDQLWLVVSGAPQEHWRHAWDDDNSNDEHWPYQVQFANTNLLGQPNPPTTPITPNPTFTLSTSVVGSGTVSPASGTYEMGTTQSLTAIPNAGFVFTGWSGDATGTENPLSLTMNSNKTLVANFASIPVTTMTYNITMEPRSDYTSVAVPLNSDSISRVFNLSAAQIAAALGSTITYYAVNPDGSLDANSTAVAPGHWYGTAGNVVNYGEQAYVYSELNINSMEANIGQYPDKSSVGDSYTVRQALVYRKSATEIFQITFVYNITINSATTALALRPQQNGIFNLRGGALEILGDAQGLEIFDLRGQRILSQGPTKGVHSVQLETLPRGVLWVRVQRNGSDVPILQSFVNK